MMPYVTADIHSQGHLHSLSPSPTQGSTATWNILSLKEGITCFGMKEDYTILEEHLIDYLRDASNGTSLVRLLDA